MPETKKIFSLIFESLYLAVLVGLGIFLFAQDSFNAAAPDYASLHAASRDTLRIAYANMPTSLNPLNFDGVTRSYLGDIYESLVKTDKYLKVQPSIAVSWGMLDSNTWEFTLRPGVKFHNDKLLTQDDVLYSFDQAMTNDQSGLKDVLYSVDKVEKKSTDKIVIHTKQPDPILLSKLAEVYIFPKNYTDFEHPVGTGPYKFVTKDDKTMSLEIFNNYYGTMPVFRNVVLSYVPDKDDRVSYMEQNKIDLLANVPPNYACDPLGSYADAQGCTFFENRDVKIATVPSLEVGFLMFNFNNPVLDNLVVRKAITNAIDRKFFVDLAFGYALPSSQFLSAGVFGFNPNITASDYDLSAATDAVQQYLQSSFDVPHLTFDYPQELQIMADYIKTQLTKLGLVVDLDPLPADQLLQKIESGQSDMYYLGWRSELGDGMDFFTSIAHSKAGDFGKYNSTNYQNGQVDALIEKNVTNMDAETRLKDLQNVMKILVQGDVIGMPLYESKTIFAYNKNIEFTPRIDGYIHAAEIN